MQTNHEAQSKEYLNLIDRQQDKIEILLQTKKEQLNRINFDVQLIKQKTALIEEEKENNKKLNKIINDKKNIIKYLHKENNKEMRRALERVDQYRELVKGLEQKCRKMS